MAVSIELELRLFEFRASDYVGNGTEFLIQVYISADMSPRAPTFERDPVVCVFSLCSSRISESPYL